jgi:hypothetical protein
MTQENPSLCYDNEKEETQEREELFKQLKKRNKKLKKEIKEYQLLNHVIQQENSRFKA